MEDFFNIKNIIEILIRWKYYLLTIVSIAIILAIIFSSPIFIIPLFKSYAIVYPSNISSYSGESQTEQMMQMLQSNDIRDSIIKKFDLPEHYNIDRNDKYFMSNLLMEFGAKVKFTKTPYEAVNIEVWDKNPKIACDIVNEILFQFNFKVRGLQKEKFGEVVTNFRIIKEMKRKELDSLANAVKELGIKYGILDWATQTREVMRGFLGTGGTSVNKKEVNRLKKNMEEKVGERELLFHLITAEANGYSILKLDFDRTIIDYNRNYTYVNMLNKPFPADKKSYPVRWILVILSAIGTAILAIFFIGFIERRKILHSESKTQ